MRVAGLILAAGAGSRFGGAKLLARIDGAAILARVVATARAAGLDPIVVVTSPALEDHAPALGIEPAELVVNAEPERGLSSSLLLGLAALEAEAEAEAGAAQPAAAATADAVAILLGDQPLVRASWVRRLVEALAEAPPAIAAVVPRYAGGGSPNPVVLRRAGFGLAAETDGDRGLGPVLAEHPEAVVEVDLSGSNPDVDTTEDLAAVAEAAWAGRVRENHDQVDRLREVPDGQDFYAKVSSVFRDDPDRSGDAVLDALLALARPNDTWLDIGAGAGRYALPLARRVQRVLAVDPSPGMLGALREARDEHRIENLEIVEGRWPGALEALGSPPVADVALIAHVGYDVAEIGAFVEAMERAARRLCVAVLMERSPATLAEAFWPPVHGEPRISLPGLPAFVDLLVARGRAPEVRIVDSARRRWSSRDELIVQLRRQTWVEPDGAKDRQLLALLDRWLVTNPDGTLELSTADPLRVGVATWSPG